MKIHYKQVDEERVMKLWRDGLSLTVISKRMGVSYSKIREIVKRHEEAKDAGHGRG